MQVKTLTFDTGGTILDWHSGVSSAFQSLSGIVHFLLILAKDR